MTEALDFCDFAPNDPSCATDQIDDVPAEDSGNDEGYDCFDEESCGIQEGFPFYFDPNADTDSVFRSVKVSLFNGFLIAFIFYFKD